MFIRIKSIGRDSRFKDSSISAFNVDGQSASTGNWYITIRISNRDVKFSWKTEKGMRVVEEYLDNVLKVQEV